MIMKSKKIFALLILLAGTAACDESFIDRPSQTGPSTDNYYNTADQVRSATSTLYGLPWSDFENRAMDVIGDVMAGNMYTANNDDAPFVNFTLSEASVRLQSAWSSFYKIGGWTSTLIQVLEQKKKQGGNAEFIDPAIAECHFLRGTVYFYIGRIWGDAPIVTDPASVALSGNFNIPRYFQEDVLRFALEELKLAEAGLPENDEPGRLTTYSAKGMMAKLYLYIKDYDNAKTKALEVIESNKYSLVGMDNPNNYAAMFSSSSYNNNIESLFSIQHQLTQDPWGSGNQKNPDRGPSNLQTDEASMWELYIPSMDMRNAYEPGDIRRAASMMEHGWGKSAWKPQRSGNNAYNSFMASGYKYDTLEASPIGTKNPTRSNVAKYVVGPGSKYGGETVIGMNTGINLMILRYADILLIYAEAVLGDQASTTDAKALEYFNLVRQRARVSEKTVITLDDIINERRVEFAFEGDFWFDLQRMGYTKAKEIIESQNRGTAEFPLYVTFEEDMLRLPIPLAETLQDPELLKDPVSYYND